MDIEKTELSKRVKSCLEKTEIYTLEQLREKSFSEILLIPNLGEKGVDEIQEFLKNTKFEVESCCLNCYHGNEFEHFGDEETVLIGVCFRNPPVLVGDSEDRLKGWRQPLVNQMGICSEWRKK